MMPLIQIPTRKRCLNRICRVLQSVVDVGVVFPGVLAFEIFVVCDYNKACFRRCSLMMLIFGPVAQLAEQAALNR